jgi:hypothetical protein
VPVVVRDRTAEELVDDGRAYDQLLTIVQALAANDARIIEYFRVVAIGRRQPNGREIFSIEMNERIGARLKVEDFVRVLELKVWNRLGRLTWLPYDEAVTFMHALGLKNSLQQRPNGHCVSACNGAPPCSRRALADWRVRWRVRSAG